MSGTSIMEGLVDHEKTGIERIILIPEEPSRFGIGLEQPVDALGPLPRCLAHALGGAPRRIENWLLG